MAVNDVGAFSVVMHTVIKFLICIHIKLDYEKKTSIDHVFLRIKLPHL